MCVKVRLVKIGLLNLKRIKKNQREYNVLAFFKGFVYFTFVKNIIIVMGVFCNNRSILLFLYSFSKINSSAKSSTSTILLEPAFL